MTLRPAFPNVSQTRPRSTHMPASDQHMSCRHLRPYTQRAHRPPVPPLPTTAQLPPVPPLPTTAQLPPVPPLPTTAQLPHMPPRPTPPITTTLHTMTVHETTPTSTPYQTPLGMTQPSSDERHDQTGHIRCLPTNSATNQHLQQTDYQWPDYYGHQMHRHHGQHSRGRPTLTSPRTLYPIPHPTYSTTHHR